MDRGETQDVGTRLAGGEVTLTQNSENHPRGWRLLQGLVWTIGLGLVVLLLAWPVAGLHAFWNILIPVAPVLVAVAPGLWRNVCPLASTALVARHVGFSNRRQLSRQAQGRLLLGGVILLFLIVPLRHVILDTSSAGTAITLILIAILSANLGTHFEWKSAWCSGLCPVHGVERLYGSEPAFTFDNAHCTECARCVSMCPDSTPGADPLLDVNSGRPQRIAGFLMIGAFPGFVWGWFHVPDWRGIEGWRHLDVAYGIPLGAGLVTLIAFAAILPWVHGDVRRFLVRIFAAAAIACYYWYRVPALFGFGPLPGDGMLVDLRGTLPESFPFWCRVLTTTFFAWWLVGRRGGRRAWARRPAFEA